MTPIERLRNLVAASKMSNVHWDGTEDLAALLAAYGAERALRTHYEQKPGEMDGESAHSEWRRKRNFLESIADFAVAKVEGRKP